ncbi:unnamed protein product [Caenorhabditis auriculariae]|uniref:Fucosyltransferase n=1 Tax=Caenorhabditis auriculariae TaxID=2777116 RepID=A0A8S1HPP7_9PELO|nr:unnamed protein product [Caenorhabditis auriculariae]
MLKFVPRYFLFLLIFCGLAAFWIIFSAQRTNSISWLFIHEKQESEGTVSSTEINSTSKIEPVTSESVSKTPLRIHPNKSETSHQPSKKVVIFAATKYFSQRIQDAAFMDLCHQTTKDYCRITDDFRELNSSDAVIFHYRNYPTQMMSSNETERRKEESIWRHPIRPIILMTQESPISDDLSRVQSDLINWTMTYRQNSDIWYPYAHLVRREQEQKVDFEAIWAMKNHNKTASWLVSNCETSNHRLKLGKKIREIGLSIDIYGACGLSIPNCPSGMACAVSTLKPYKFYMAFENANCKQYVTEKFFEALRSRISVPIVISRRFYKNVAPAESFIAVDDFSNLKDFVAHVIRVSNDKALYLKYHEWRQIYEVKLGDDEGTGMCELCRRLQYPIDSSKIYKDLASWYRNDDTCDQSIALRFFDIPSDPGS